MSIQRIAIQDFVALSFNHPVIDVRSPSEYAHAHIPTAYSIPIFDDEQRKIIGTAYKQNSREEAIKIGLDYFGTKMRAMVEQVAQLSKNYTGKKILVHCWRGGMRSGAVAWLLDLYGFEVCTLDGGYKAFRNWVLEQFAKTYRLKVLSGYTGSGKTEILQEFVSHGELVIDLERMAGHKGSAFGNLGLPLQPSNEQFENKLAFALYQNINSNVPNPMIWLESESSRIGNLNIPSDFFGQMKSAERITVYIPFEQRLDYIMQGYGHFAIEELIAATERIKNRLGGLETKMTIEYFKNNELRSAFAVLLRYYDRYYDKSILKYEHKSLEIKLEQLNPKKNAPIILKQIKL